jgi:uncharacterized protein (TIGR03083 family)
MGDTGEAREVLSLLRAASTSLDEQVRELDGEALLRPSYCSDWTVAQVLSHLGSGAQIFSKVFAAAVAGVEPPGQADFVPIWDEWNAKDATGQAESYLAANGAFLDELEGLDDETLAGLSIEIFHSTRDAAGLLRMRLSEQVLHSWDVAVSLDPAADLFAEAVPEVLGGLHVIVGWAGKPTGAEHEVAVHTIDPDRDLVLSVGEHVELRAAGEEAGGPEARLDLPANALIRLVYGRLDADHTPEGVTATGVELDELRAVFPGL